MTRPRTFTSSGDSVSSLSSGHCTDDNCSVVLHSSDSVSSLAASIGEDGRGEESRKASRRKGGGARGYDEAEWVCPVERLPSEILICIFSRLSSITDLRSCALVSRRWAANSVGLLWFRPHTFDWAVIHLVIRSIVNPSRFNYSRMIRRLNLTALAKQVGDSTLRSFLTCNRIERLTLTNCHKLTDLSVGAIVSGNPHLQTLDVSGMDGLTSLTLLKLAESCNGLEGLNLTDCSNVTDDGLEAVAMACRNLRRLKLNNCTLITSGPLVKIAENAHGLVEIDLHRVINVTDEIVELLLLQCKYLRELRLAHCHRISDGAFEKLASGGRILESLRIIDLTDCGEIQDVGVQRIIAAAPKLRNLVLAKCRQITDRSVMAITRLGKNLHYIHLGHCSRITDVGLSQLIRYCNRIRYIDLACCSQLTDSSVQLLATLPKLKRIGLVKCDSITDRSIYALARPRFAVTNNVAALSGYYTSIVTNQYGSGVILPSCLERVHLSYCRNLTLSGVHALLVNCPRLTHLSLTGVQAFLREDLVVFCREAPPEFNEHQRNLFCVFSGQGVEDLRRYLNESYLAAQAREEVTEHVYDPTTIVAAPAAVHPSINATVSVAAVAGSMQATNQGGVTDEGWGGDGIYHVAGADESGEEMEGRS